MFEDNLKESSKNLCSKSETLKAVVLSTDNEGSRETFQMQEKIDDMFEGSICASDTENTSKESSNI
jgi:hypothetical protein